MASLDDLVTALEGMKGRIDEKNVTLDLSKRNEEASREQDVELPKVYDDQPPWIDEWEDQEKELQIVHDESQSVEPLFPKQPELVFLPMLLQHAWMAPKGSPEKYVRSFRGLSFVSTTDVYPSGKPIGLPSGLQARRLLLALVSRSLTENSRSIDVSSICELMRWTGMTITSYQHRKIQKTLFQLAMANISIWFSPTGDKAQIFKGVMFDSLNVDVVESSQERFSFIPNEVVFSENFYKSVIEGKAMPFIASDVHKATSPIQHDILLWLLHRQGEINKPLFLGYGLMFHQFGQPNQTYAKFKYVFKKAMRQIQSKWDRKLEVKKDGIILHPMPFHVGMKKEKWGKWRSPVL